jgi:hypothetical protein
VSLQKKFKLGLTALILGSYAGPAIAQIECSPTALMAKDAISVQTSPTVELAFALTASQREYDAAKAVLGTGRSGLIVSSTSLDEARSNAQRLAPAIRFDRSRADYLV